MKTLLVTGGAGFIGSNFIRYWLGKYKNDFVINLDLLTYAGYLKNLEDVEKKYKKRYKFIKGNIGNTELITHILKTYKPEIVVNFAAESHNSRAIVNPGVFYETNVLGIQKLIDCVRGSSVKRLHHISTCEVYGDLPLNSKEKFTEKSPYKPNTPYNSSKASADLVAKVYYKTFNVPVSISVCSNNYGPYQFPEKVIPLFITNALTGKKMTLYKQSKNKREWLHVLDHCRAIDLILTKGKVSEVYNIGSGIELDVDTLADKIVKILKLDPSVKTYIQDRPSHDRRYLLDSSKIRRELGWKPTVSLEKGMKDTVEWYVKNKDWWEPLIEKRPVEEGKW